MARSGGKAVARTLRSKDVRVLDSTYYDVSRNENMFCFLIEHVFQVRYLGVKDSTATRFFARPPCYTRSKLGRTLHDLSGWRELLASLSLRSRPAFLTTLPVRLHSRYTSAYGSCHVRLSGTLPPLTCASSRKSKEHAFSFRQQLSAWR